jgi:hypothetical protein
LAEEAESELPVEGVNWEYKNRSHDIL